LIVNSGDRGMTSEQPPAVPAVAEFSVRQRMRTFLLCVLG
jgi:hypothetical protein